MAGSRTVTPRRSPTGLPWQLPVGLCLGGGTSLFLGARPSQASHQWAPGRDQMADGKAGQRFIPPLPVPSWAIGVRGGGEAPSGSRRGVLARPQWLSSL